MKVISQTESFLHHIFALDSKIFHDKILTYIKNNDTSTVKSLLELGMDQQIFKDDLILLSNNSERQSILL